MSHSRKEMISFFVTTKCNLNCIYCYTNKNTGEHRHQTLNYDFAKVGIDDYYSTSYDKHVRFFGAGEPTIELELIKRILAYAKEKEPSTTAEMQTNGCFSETTASWIANNIDIVWISSDGRPQFQDYYRPTINAGKSSPLLERNIRYLCANGKGMAGVRMTITQQNSKEQISNIDYFKDLGIRNFWVDPIFPAVGETQPLDAVDMNSFVSDFVQAVKYAHTCGMTYGSILTCNFDEPGELACRALLPVPHLTTDGFVSACDMALYGEDADHIDLFIYGKWDAISNKIIYDEKKIEYLRSINLQNLPKCAKCEVGVYCRGYCPGEVVNETHDLFGCKQGICRPTIEIFKQLTDIEKSYKYSHP